MAGASMIYRISDAYNEYLNIDIDPFDLLEAMGGSISPEQFDSYAWDLRSLRDIWVDIGGSFMADDESLIKPDIAIWDSSNLVLSPKAFMAIGDKLEKYGEFMPITIEGETYQVFHCLNAINADLSVSKSIIKEGFWQGVSALGFDEYSTINQLVFTARFDRCSTLFCSDDFKQLIDSHMLKGLIFNEDLVGDF